MVPDGWNLSGENRAVYFPGHHQTQISGSERTENHQYKNSLMNRNEDLSRIIGNRTHGASRLLSAGPVAHQVTFPPGVQDLGSACLETGRYRFRAEHHHNTAPEEKHEVIMPTLRIPSEQPAPVLPRMRAQGQ